MQVESEVKNEKAKAVLSVNSNDQIHESPKNEKKEAIPPTAIGKKNVKFLKNNAYLNVSMTNQLLQDYCNMYNYHDFEESSESCRKYTELPNKRKEISHISDTDELCSKEAADQTIVDTTIKKENNEKPNTEFVTQSEKLEGAVGTEAADSDYSIDVCVGRRLSYTRHKILKKLRKDNPELFKLNYAGTTLAEKLNIDVHDPELKQFIENIGIDAGNTTGAKQQNCFKTLHNDNLLSDDNVNSDVHSYLDGFELKEKYSSITFELLSKIVMNYADFLKKHPNEGYLSVSEIIINPDQKLKKEESEKMRFYDGTHMKIRAKKESGISKKSKNDSAVVRTEQNKDKNTNTKDIDTHETEIDPRLTEALKRSRRAKMERSTNFRYATSDDYGPGLGFTRKSFKENKNTKEILTLDEINLTRKTGSLNLSHKSLVQVPDKVWSIDLVTEDEKKIFSDSLSQLDKINWYMFKPISTLILNYNSLTTFSPQGTTLLSLRYLSATNNMLDELPEEIGCFKVLERLNLETNYIKVLPENISRLKTLVTLKLKRNFLENLPESIGELVSLKKLDISFNKLCKLPNTLTGLQNLEELDLSFNKINVLPERMNTMKNIKKINLSHNHIDSFPQLNDLPKLSMMNAMNNRINVFPNFSGCHLLIELRLDGNRMKNVLTNNFFGCPLIQFTVSNNRIERIPDDMNSIPTLVLIDFSNNQVSWLPWSLGRLKYLTCVKVDGNSISNVDQSIIEAGSNKIIDFLRKKKTSYEVYELNGENKYKDGDTKIEMLYEKNHEGNSTNLNTKQIYGKEGEMENSHRLILKDMGLNVLSNELMKKAGGNNVYSVDLSKNNFSFIPTGLKVLIPLLSELIIPYNNLKTIPDFIGRMNRLQYLDIGNNYIETFPLSMRTSILKKLIANNNCFNLIPKVVYSIYTLEHINFSENKITEIDVEGLKCLKKLIHLNLRDNLITKLPCGLGYLTNISELNVFNNCFKRPGFNILKKGTKSIFEYLRENEDKIDFKS